MKWQNFFGATLGIALIAFFGALIAEATMRSIWIFTAIVGGIGAVLMTIFALFKAARRPTCTWPKTWRRVAQAPGWLLVALGFYVVCGLAWMGNPLGLGTVAAMITAALKALAKPAEE